MNYTLSPVLSKTFSGSDADFNGDRGVAFQAAAGPTIVGAITMAAIIKIASWDDVKDQFHYIISQNNGDNTQPENFSAYEETVRVCFLNAACGSTK
jgi:hypothetical protein